MNTERLTKIYYFNVVDVGVNANSITPQLYIIESTGDTAPTRAYLRRIIYIHHVIILSVRTMYRNRDYGRPSTHDSMMFTTSIFFFFNIIMYSNSHTRYHADIAVTYCNSSIIIL